MKKLRIAIKVFFSILSNERYYVYTGKGNLGHYWHGNMRVKDMWDIRDDINDACEDTINEHKLEQDIKQILKSK